MRLDLAIKDVEESSLLTQYTAIIDSIRHDFYPSHAVYRKRIMSDLKRGMELFRHVPGGWAGAMYVQQESAFKLAKGTKVKGPSWYAVAKCDNCDGMQITDSSISQAKRWKCLTCGEVCDIGWVEEEGRLKAIESQEKALDAHATGVRKVNASERSSIEMHRKSVKKNGCKSGRGCRWCE